MGKWYIDKLELKMYVLQLKMLSLTNSCCSKDYAGVILTKYLKDNE